MATNQLPTGDAHYIMMQQSLQQRRGDTEAELVEEVSIEETIPVASLPARVLSSPSLPTASSFPTAATEYQVQFVEAKAELLPNQTASTSSAAVSENGQDNGSEVAIRTDAVAVVLTTTEADTPSVMSSHNERLAATRTTRAAATASSANASVTAQRVIGRQRRGVVSTRRSQSRQRQLSSSSTPSSRGPIVNVLQSDSSFASLEESKIPEEVQQQLKRMKSRRKVKQVAAAVAGAVGGCLLGPIGAAIGGIGAHTVVREQGRARELELRERYEPAGVAIPLNQEEREQDTQ